MAKIAIIGAGLSGVQCGKLLTERGHTVNLFEKSRGVGGRMSTRRLDWSHLDLGAQYFTARSSIMRQCIDQWLAAGWISKWSFTPYKVKEGGIAPSPDETPRYVAVPDMNHLCKNLAEGLSVTKSVCITDIERHADQWVLRAESGENFEGFDWVVASLPAEQSKNLLRKEAIASEIPDRVHAPCWALALGTEGEADPNIQGVFGDKTISWVSRQNSKPARAICQTIDDAWILHFSSDWSERRGKYLDQNIIALGQQWLESALNTSLKVTHSYHHFWRFANITPDSRNIGCLCDKTRQIGVIGDWTVGGKISGAIESAHAFVAEYF